MSSTADKVCGRLRMLVAIAAGMLLGACTVATSELTLEEKREDIAIDRMMLFADQEPVEGPITLQEALVRALRYNFDNRLKLMEEALSNEQLDLSRFDLLPQLTLNAGYLARDSNNISLSEDLSTGRVSTNPFLSQDRQLADASLGLTWNILDFGVSYYQAKQNADRVHIANESRRRVVNQIVQGVRSAYWRAATAEPLYEQIKPILVQARQALEDSRRTERERLVPLLESLQYQKELVEIIRELNALEYDMAVAKAEMASLMGMAPGSDFSLVLPPVDAMQVPEIAMTIEEMENLALENKPELNEERYQTRITAAETRKSMLRLFPSLMLNVDQKYESNSYLLNQSWADAGARVAWNLINLAKYPAERRSARVSEQLADLRRLALSMATMTQMHVGYHQYRRAVSEYEQALQLDDIEQRIFNNINQAVSAQSRSQLQQIRARMSAVYAEVNRYRAYSELQSSLANLYVSLGIDLTPENLLLDGETIDTQTLRVADAAGEAGGDTDGTVGTGGAGGTEGTVQPPRPKITVASLIGAENVRDPGQESSAAMPESPLAGEGNTRSVRPRPEAIQLNEYERELLARQREYEVRQGLGAFSSFDVPPIGSGLHRDETEDGLKQEVRSFIGEWLQAWEMRNTSGYFASYDADFLSGDGMSLDDWKESRGMMLIRDDTLDIDLLKIEPLTLWSKMTTLEVVLRMDAGGRRDESRKRLILHRTDEGWRILREIDIATEVANT